jgi:diguanylate cyclase (GGDEF)-like protein
MFLLCGAHSTAIDDGTDITVQFTNPYRPADSYQLGGKVARAKEHGLGVSFTSVNQVAMTVLAKLAEKQATAIQQSGGRVMGDVSAIVNSCRQVGMISLRKMVDVFFDTAYERLFDAAEHSASNIQQSAFFGARNELRKGRDALSGKILAELEQRFGVLDQAGYRSPSLSPEGDSGGDLSLVDTQEFDKWLVVRSIASKVEGQMTDVLEALETRLAAIAVNRVDKESNPVGPLTVASVFSYTLDTLMLEDVAKKTIYLLMEGLFDQELKKLYDELNTLLIEHGVLPELKKTMEVVKMPGSDSRAGYVEHGMAEVVADGAQEPLSSQAPAAGIPQGGGYRGAVAMSPAEAAIDAGGAAPAPWLAPAGMVPAPAQSASSPQAAPQSSQQVASGPLAPRLSYRHVTTLAEALPAMADGPVVPFQNMQELMHLHGSGADVAPVSPNGYFSSGEVMQALAHLEGAVAAAERAELTAVGHARFLAETLANLTGEAGKGLSEEDRDTVTYVGGLFSSMHQDKHLPHVVRPWLERMEVPLLKAGIIDPGMMDDAEHPARQVVNRLEQVGRHVESDKSENSEEIRRQVEDLLEAIQKRVDEDPQVFADVIARLDEIREGYSASYRKNVDFIIKQCEQESSLNRVREVILQALNELLGKREVPKVILTLLESGFKNLLFRTHVKSGPDSEAYNSYLSFIDLLTARLARREPVKAKALADDATLLQWLPRMLASASKDEGRNTALINELKSYLDGQARPEMQYVPALIVKSTHQDEAHSKPDALDIDAWQLVLDDARHINDGTSFVYADEEQGEQEVTLVWRDEEGKLPRYVFVDNNGEKMLDLSLGEVASLIHYHALAPMDVRELSVTERATYDFLQGIQNNLSHQAQHDELTGLLNRKSFERELDDTYNAAVATGRSGVLGYFDLDRFNVINTTCGHTQGDKLLVQVAALLRANVGENATVARLGGDEFAIILEGASRVEGLKRITALHDEIRDIRFACDENEFNVTASVGLAEINNSSDSSGRLLSAVDAACFTAKDQGRDNIQIHNPENIRISNRTTILEWVGRINVLFEKNLIQLRCQKIEPVQKTVNSLPHYEVLLDVHDEEGNKVPLDEFIVAAERYNRIIDIDTWVVDYVLNWLEEHCSKLNRISGLSINLSGNSIGNRKFMEHVQGRLSAADFPADKVIFEVTETIAINNIDNAARFMRKLKEVGCRFSLDDFGSGTSSYSYLKSLPIDYLKIDGAFVKDIARNANDYAVVKSINEIGHVMGKKTVAEYVEDEFAYQALKAIGLDYVQGFGIEKPIPLYKLFG